MRCRKTMPPTPQITTSSSTKRPAGDELQTARAGGAQTLKARGQQGGGGTGHSSQPQGSPTPGTVTPGSKGRRKLLGKNYYFREQFTLISSPLTPSSSAEPPWAPSAQQCRHGCQSLLQRSQTTAVRTKVLNVQEEIRPPFPPPCYLLH